MHPQLQLNVDTHAFRAHIQTAVVQLTALQEAMTRKRSVDLINGKVAPLTKQLGKLFVRQGNALVKGLTPLNKYFKESAIERDFKRLFDKLTLNTSVQMQELLTKAVREMFLAGGNEASKALELNISFSLDSPLAREYLANYGANLITGIDDTTRAEILAMLQAGMAQKISFTEIARNIKAKFKEFAVGQPQEHIRSRAELVAVTELGNAYSAGNYASVESAEVGGLTFEKAWLTVNDSRVSDGCWNNQQAGWIDLKKPFPSGHTHPLRFPGCRCVALYQRKKD